MRDGVRPLVFSTLVDPDISVVVTQGQRPGAGLLPDLHRADGGRAGRPLFARGRPLAQRGRQLRLFPPHRRGQLRAVSYDDGQSTKELENADVILVGVSRSGKTPTCLYLALQYGMRAANYPLIPEDFGAMKLPGMLNRLRRKLFGLDDPARPPAPDPQRAAPRQPVRVARPTASPRCARPRR